MHSRRFAAMIVLLTVLVACGDSVPAPAVLSVTISGGDQELTVGQSVMLAAEVTVTGAASTSVSWTTSNPDVAGVSITGRVEAIEPGTAVITASSAVDRTKSSSIRVTVSAPTPRVISVTIDQGDRTLMRGNAFTFTATVHGEGGAGTAVVWGTSDTAVAPADPATGRVTAEAPGTATITATSTDDATKSDSVTVTVVEALPPTGTVAGTITVGGGSTAANTGLRASTDRLEMPQRTLGDAPFVPGEIIVGFAADVSARSATPLAVAGRRLWVIESIPALDAQLLGHRSLSATETLQAILELQRHPDVRYAQPNYIVQTAAIPNDPHYALQWHYPAIDLPGAWDVTTGSPSVVVAVVDTGILHSSSVPSRTHPDLEGKVLPGYDFISDYRVAGDGDGRDPDPYDVGDNPYGQSSYHGSHVAGTIAAATNNGVGVAGVDWKASILPVRVLGIGGGTLFDMVQGTLWAAGQPIAGVPDNPHPAHVINLSLGAERSCSAVEQDAFDWIASFSPRRSIVVAAAGNSDVDAALFAPANCRNVITVGATDARDRRAPYSNYGSRIDVMAPGGDMGVDWTGDTLPDGVLSLGRDDATGSFGYWFAQGTSMAAPHVAGVASLMKSLDPDITQADVLAALQATARPLTASGCNRPSGAACGAGLIDAAAALALIRDETIPTPGVGQLVFEPGVLDFGTASGSLDVTLRNAGGSTLAWEATQFLASTQNPGDMPDHSVLISDVSGTIPAGGAHVVSLAVDRDLVTAEGAYEFAVVFEVFGEAAPALLYASFIKADTAAPSLNGPTIVAAYVENDIGELTLSGYVYSDTFISAFAFEALAGANEVIAWSDENGNGAIDAGDYLGVFPGRVTVIAGEVTSGVAISIDEIVHLSSSPTASAHAAAHEPWRVTLEELARRRSP
jgi:serine protease